MPYDIPRNILKALLQYHKHREITLNLATTSNHISSLHNIKLECCDFKGNTLSNINTNDGKFVRKEVSRIAKPCWLQHRQSNHRMFKILESQTEDGQIELNDKMSTRNEEKTDPGLNELSDYFRHFVCLCAPKMSDLAQSMYA
jgi:hypothetical protein